jgi:hypothetical protein
MLQLAEVKNTTIAFKPFKDENGDEWPLGTIGIQVLSSNIRERSVFDYASPFSLSRRIPLVGEHVIIFKAPGIFSEAAGRNTDVFYYLDPISIQGDINCNLLPNYSVTYVQPSNNFNKATAPIIAKNTPFKPGENFKEQNVKPLQPFEGETLIESRFGNSIRLGTTYTNYSIYQTNPTYTTNQNGAPILILRNGTGTAGPGNAYVVEDIEKDKSSIYLTSNQQLTAFKGAQPKVGLGVKLLSLYKDPQVALSSDRIVLNAKRDNILLVSKTDVVIATPKWQMQMDKLFTLLETFVNEVNKVLSGQQPLPTGSGPTGPAPNLAQLQRVVSELKTMKQ